MEPIQDVLHRIRWDPEFGRGRFAVGYWDRLAKREEVVPFGAIEFDPANPGVLLVQDPIERRHIPLHRVRAVYKNGVEIWRRPIVDR